MILELEKENYVTKLLEQHPGITSIEKYTEPDKSFSFSPMIWKKPKYDLYISKIKRLTKVTTEL